MYIHEAIKTVFGFRRTVFCYSLPHLLPKDGLTKDGRMDERTGQWLDGRIKGRMNGGTKPLEEIRRHV